MTADRTKVWYFLKLLMLLALSFFGPLSVGLAVFASWGIAAVVLIVVPIVALGLIGLGVGLYWKWGAARVRYEFDGTSLSARRGDKIVKSVGYESIDSVRMSGEITWTIVLSFVEIPPTLPCLIVTVKSQKGGIKTVGFPEILLWGVDSVERANRDLHHALGFSAEYED